MFAQHFFGKAFWGGSYWGKGGAAAATTPVDLTDALARWIRTQTAAAPLTQVYNGGAGTGAGRPYLILQETGSRLIRTSSSTKTYQKTINFRFVSEDLDQAGRIGDALRPALIQQSFRWTGGRSNRPVEVNRRHVKETGQTADGGYRYSLSVDYEFRARIGVVNGA